MRTKDNIIDGRVVDEFLICKCGGKDHLIRVNYFPEDAEEGIYLDVQLVKTPWWYVRVWTIIKYLFGKGDFDNWCEFILSERDAIKLKNIIIRYLKESNYNDGVTTTEG